MFYNVNMSTLNTDMMGLRERRPEALKKQNGNWTETTQRPHHVLTYPTTVMYVYSRSPSESRRTSAAFEDIDKTRRRFGQVSSSREWRGEGLIALKNWEELEEVYGIPVIVKFNLSLFFSPLAFIWCSFYISIAHPRGHLMFGTGGGLVAWN